MPLLLLALAIFVGALAEAPAPTPLRIEIRAAPGLVSPEDLARLTGWAGRQGGKIEIGAEDAPVAPDSRVTRVCVIPPSPSFARRLEKFGVRADAGGFTFDGRAYRGAEDGVVLRDPADGRETLVVANSRDVAVRLAVRPLFRGRGDDADYRVTAGGLAKSGRFASKEGRLVVDRRTDRDEVADRDRFFETLQALERDGVRWRFPPGQDVSVARFEPAVRRAQRPGRRLRVVVTLFPDPTTKSRFTGSSRPADLRREGQEVHLDLDASAPPVPDCAGPVIAAAGYASEEPKLLARSTLLMALGARAAGRWWGREVASFAAFTDRARVGISVDEAIGDAEEVSPVLAVGTAAAWLDAGVRADGEQAVIRILTGPAGPLADALKRWAAIAIHRGGPVSPIPRRTVPAGFLRGLSYAMSNSLDAGYASPRSRETLARLVRLGANSVSVMPFAFSPRADRPVLSFVHRHPQGETDEATVRAVTDAKTLGMTALVKPQIWVGGEEFVGRIAMRSDAEWREWFDLYRRFVVHHAVVAEAAGAAIFCVGTELVGTESRAREWRDTIDAVRLATGAPLTYAANWSGGAARLPFWDALDVIGVDFYDPLSADPSATDSALEAGARAAARPLSDLARRTAKPVVFTEAGYPLARAAWMAPHDENTGRPPSASDAARAIAAVYRALEKEPWWRGVYWWKTFSSGRDAGADERGFNVLGGLPEKAVAEGFGRLISRERAASK